MTHAKPHFLVLILNSTAGFFPHFLVSGMICVSEQCLKRSMWLKCVQWENHKWFKYFLPEELVIGTVYELCCVTWEKHPEQNLRAVVVKGRKIP